MVTTGEHVTIPLRKQHEKHNRLVAMLAQTCGSFRCGLDQLLVLTPVIRPSVRYVLFPRLSPQHRCAAGRDLPMCTDLAVPEAAAGSWRFDAERLATIIDLPALDISKNQK